MCHAAAVDCVNVVMMYGNGDVSTLKVAWHKIFVNTWHRSEWEYTSREPSKMGSRISPLSLDSLERAFALFARGDYCAPNFQLYYARGVFFSFCTHQWNQHNVSPSGQSGSESVCEWWEASTRSTTLYNWILILANTLQLLEPHFRWNMNRAHLAETRSESTVRCKSVIRWL